jgi:uncharacterized protein
MIIDTDSHLIEPADMWTARMSAKKWGDYIPHVRFDDILGKQGWYVGGTRVADVGPSIAIPDEDGNPIRFQGPPLDAPSHFDLMHPSAYDGAERIKVLDQHGIDAAVLYPNLGLSMTPQLDKLIHFDIEEYRLDVVKTWNDAVLDWISPDPTRFIPLASVPYWDVKATVAEIERCAPLGFKGIITTGAPHAHGLPFMPDHHWDPVWAAAQAHGMSVNFHVGGGDLTQHMQPERIAIEGQSIMYSRVCVDIFLDNAIILTDLLFSGVLARFPDLKFVMVESGIGWIPFCLEAADYHFLRVGDVRRERPELDLLPSEYFQRQVYANYWFEQLEPWHLEKIGIDNILWETDYPHPTCLLGSDVSEAIATGFANTSESDRDAILWRNAAKLYGLTTATKST